MENRLENKVKFFAQFYGQLIVGHNQYTKNQLSSVYHYLNTLIKNDDGYFLELKPLSSITDEDAIEVARICKPNDEHHHDVRTGKGLVKSLNNTMQTFPKYQSLTDYLRSKGYALPYMGLSVKKLVEYGWIKLKGANHEQ